MSGKGPEQRVPTNLVDREVASSDGLDEGLRIGPYMVFRELVQAPVVRLVEALDKQGKRVLLQLARCRPATTDKQNTERQDYVRMVASATEHLSADADVEVLAHGAVEDADGSRTLFWAMPWPDGADHLGRAIAQTATAEQVVAAATSLMERLVERHARGRMDPLLCEHMLITRPTGAVSCAGLSIHLPGEWIEAGPFNARLAPEERDPGEPTFAGDMWRAGKALGALASDVDPLPAALEGLIASLCHQDVGTRIVDPQAVLVELESYEGTLAQEAPSSTVEEEAPPEVPSDWSEETVTAAETGDEDAAPDAPPIAESDDAETDSHAKADLQAAASEALTIQPTGPQHGTASERPTKPPGIWTRAKEAQTIRVPYPNTDEAKADEPGTSSMDDTPLADDGEQPKKDEKIEFVSVPNASPIPEAPTLLDARAKAEAEEDERKRATFTKQPNSNPPKDPPLFARTLVDEPLPPEGAAPNDPASEMTLRDVSRADLEAQDQQQRQGDNSEFPTVDESIKPRGRNPAPPTKRTVWDQSTPGSVNPAAAAAAAAVHPQGPAGTLIGPLGPRGTVVGVRLIDDPTGLRPLGNPGQKALPPPALPPPRLLPPGGTLPPGAGLGPPPGAAALLPNGPNPAPAQQPPMQPIPAGRTVAGGAELVPPEAIAMRARALRPAPSDEGFAPPPGGFPPPAQQQPPQPEPAPVAPPPVHVPQPNVPAQVPASVPPSSSAPAVTPQPTPPGPSRMSLVGASVFFALFGGVVALGISYLLPKETSPTANLGNKPAAAPKPRDLGPATIGPAAEVVLEATPKDARVVAERTGRIIGTTPLRFLIPPGRDAAVLVAAKGYEPQRLVLPDRGRISTDLVPLSEREYCRVTIDAPQGIALEGFGGEVEVGTRFRIPGSVVLRSEGNGAWLVRCPKFGGKGDAKLEKFATARTVKLEVTGPWGSKILLNGKSEGKVPVDTKVSADFYEVEATDEKGKVVRWIPLVTDTVLKMPQPRAPPPPPPAKEDKPTKRKRRRRRR